MYAIPYGDASYVYMDFFSDAPRRMRCSMRYGTEATLLEATAQCRMDASCLWAEACSGYAVFRLKDT